VHFGLGGAYVVTAQDAVATRSPKMEKQKPRALVDMTGASKRSIKRAPATPTQTTIGKKRDGSDRQRALALPRATKSQRRVQKANAAKDLMPPASSRTSPKSKARPAAARTPQSESSEHRKSKQDTVIGMLRQPRGTTIAGVMAATGWQQHSVRGFLAGVVRKRLKLKLGSKKVDGGRVYQITGGEKNKSSSRHTSKRRSS
jgi:hypothetical protein